MTYKFLTLKIGKQSFAIALDKVVNLIEKPTITTEISRNSLPCMGVQFNGIHVPIFNISLFLSNKNLTKLQDSFVLILERIINHSESLVGIQIDDIPEVIEVEEFEIHPYPTVSDSNPFFIAYAKIYTENNEIVLLDFDHIFDKERMKQKIKSTQEQFLSW